MNYSIQDLREALGKCSRLSLAELPTPLVDCPRLAEKLGGPRILVKREDQTGLAFGGNKVREFEYSIAPAVDGGYDVLLHGAASQSNQSRLTAATAAKLGLKAVMVGRKDAHADPVNGNLLLTHLFGADVHLIESEEEKEAILEKLKAEGHKVYNTSSDGYYYRSVSYVDGFLELWEQLQAMEVMPDAMYVCAGVHTHTGLVVGAKALGVDLRIIGVSPSPQDDVKKNEQLAGVANEVCQILNLDLNFTADDFESYGKYAGPGYGVLTPESREAVLFAAQNEGLLLDPVYGGKTFGALIDHIRNGWYTKDQTVVFVHTGGTPALFAYADELLNLK
jgi:L-cysteate sulfo-lyase